MEGNITGYVIGAALGAALILGEILFWTLFLKTPPPHRLLILSGRRRADGRMYRVVQGGAFAFPLLETAMEMDRNVFEVKLQKGGIYLPKGDRADVGLYALVKISDEPGKADHAVERFLGQARREMEQVARETLEGVLRQVLAREDFDGCPGEEMMVRLTREVTPDFKKLGLDLTFLAVTDYTVRRLG